MGGGEVAAGEFLAGMAETGAVEGFGVAGTGLTAAELGAAGAAGAGTELLASGALQGAGTAGGISSLSPALQTAIANTAAVNAPVAEQVVQALAPSAIPSATAPIGAEQIGASSVMTPAQEAYLQASSASASPGITQGTVPLQTPVPSVASPTSMAQMAASMPAPTAADIAQMADVGMPPVEPSGFTSPLKPLYDLYKKQDPLTQDVMRYGGYGLGALGAMRALGKPTAAYSPPSYSGPLSKFKYDPNTYSPYVYRPYAAGGPVEEMSRENAIGANTGYPQANIQQGAYATPWQTPVSRNVVTGPSDANVDQMTGIERLARGGVARFEGGGAASAGDTGGSQSAEAAADAYSPSMYGPMMYSPAMMSSSLVDPVAEYAAAQPTMEMSRQNFADFLSRYQNLPITEAAPAPVTYTGLYAAGQGPKDTLDPLSTGGGDGPNMYASGGIANLGGYSDGGRLLRGPGDGMSDNIPATISGKQPARLADGEFVVPADVVSGLGNGSTDAGAKHLYSMMDKVRQARTGTKKQGKQINPRKYMPA